MSQPATRPALFRELPESFKVSLLLPQVPRTVAAVFDRRFTMCV